MKLNLIALLAFFVMNAQSEKIFVHCNNNLLITGEKIYFKIYCLNKTSGLLSDFSKVSYVEIIDRDNKSIEKLRINLINGIGQGDLVLDKITKTGTYKLLAYTKTMLNQDEIFQEDLYIVNPFDLDLDTVQNSKITNTDTVSKDLKNYNKREKVTLNLAGIITKGHYSISVKKKDNTAKKSDIKNYQNSNLKVNTNYIPEIRGSLIYGKIKASKNSENLSGVSIALTTDEKNPVTKTAVTNENGDFYFTIKNLTADAVYLQILSDTKDEYYLSLNNDIQPFTANDFPDLDLAKHFESIKKRALYAQIENAYLEVKKDSIKLLETKNSQFNISKTEYVLDDYKRFKTTKEVIVEILNNVYITKSKDNYTINIWDNLTTIDDYLKALIIVDGHVLFKHNELLEMNALDIKKISVIDERYVFGAKIFQGVLLVETFKGNYKSKHAQNFKITLKGFNKQNSTSQGILL